MKQCIDCNNLCNNDLIEYCSQCYAPILAKIESEAAAKRLAEKAEDNRRMKHRFGNVLSQIPLDALASVVSSIAPPTEKSPPIRVAASVEGFGDLWFVMNCERRPYRPLGRGKSAGYEYFWAPWSATRE